MYPISFGAIQSPEDYRNIQLADVLGYPTNLPSEYFVDIKNLPIWNQKAIGSCTGQAGGKYKQKQEEIETKTIIPFSPRWLYAMAKCEDSYLPEGTYPRLIMQIKQKYGCATEVTVPNNCDLSHEEYVYNRKRENIPASAFDEAQKYKIKSYAEVGLSCGELKQAVVKANGCMLLMKLGREWWTDKKGNVSYRPEDLSPLRPPKEIISGHEVYLYGYIDVGDDTMFYVLNSWDKRWGKDGTGWFLYNEQKPFIVEALTEIDVPNDMLEEVHNLPKPVEFKHNFERDIVRSEKNDEVKALQIALKIDGCFPKTQAETGYYGAITQIAVKKFQQKYKVASWWELMTVNGSRVGKKTRYFLNKLFNH